MHVEFNARNQSSHAVQIQPEKSLINQRFSKAAEHYQSGASVQAISANVLLEKLSLTDAGPVLLDLGSGPGCNLERLNQRAKQVIALDLSYAMLDCARDLHSDCVQADIDQLPFQSESINTVFSNFCVQWSQQPEQLFDDVYRILKPGGRVYLSTVCDGSLTEIRQAWQAVDDQPHINSFLPFDVYKALFQKSGFELLTAEQQIEVDYYPSVKQAMGSLKKIGANSTAKPKRSGLMGKSEWQKILRAYPHTEHGFGVSYAIGYFVLEK